MLREFYSLEIGMGKRKRTRSLCKDLEIYAPGDYLYQKLSDKVTTTEAGLSEGVFYGILRINDLNPINGSLRVF